MRNTNDFYPTPQTILDVLVENLDWSKRTKIWEPCAGDGRLVTTFENHGYEVIAHDIVSGNDFFDWSESPTIALVTNPPFKLIREFIAHAFKIGITQMALVCPERLWACKKGKEQFLKHQPSRFINLDWREDYLGRGGKPDRALAISIWDGEFNNRALDGINNKTKYEVWSRNGNIN